MPRERRVTDNPSNESRGIQQVIAIGMYEEDVVRILTAYGMSIDLINSMIATAASTGKCEVTFHGTVIVLTQDGEMFMIKR